MNWNKLIFGSYSREQVAQAVKDPNWQAFRISLLGLSLAMKYAKLVVYLKDTDNSEDAKIQVTNYVNALKRGGQLK